MSATLTTTRPKPKAKRLRDAAVHCPVFNLALEASALIDLHCRLDKIEVGSDGIHPVRRMEEHQHAIWDRLDAIIFAASYLVSKTAAGARFQLMLAAAETNMMESSVMSDREKRSIERRRNRLLEMATSFLMSIDTRKTEIALATDYYYGAAGVGTDPAEARREIERVGLLPT